MILIYFNTCLDFEIEQEEYEKTRNLYYRLLERTEHVKVYISFAQFELSISYEGDSDEGSTRARKIFDQAYEKMKEKELKEEVSVCMSIYICLYAN
jgi:crooked neck